MVAPAPGRFSTMTLWPRRLPRSCAIRRIGPSTAPPGEKGTITRTGRDGNSSACAGAPVNAKNVNAANARQRCMMERSAPFALAARQRGQAAQLAERSDMGALLDDLSGTRCAKYRIGQAVELSTQIGVA